jgi:hypothetical protein
MPTMPMARDSVPAASSSWRFSFSDMGFHHISLGA